MKLKILVLLCAVCLIAQTSAQESTKTDKSESLKPIEVLEPQELPIDDLSSEDTIWPFMPWKIWKWDSQLTIRQRGSSLIRSHNTLAVSEGNEASSAPMTAVVTELGTSSERSLIKRPPRSVEMELVTLLFESMLEYIIESWKLVEKKPAIETLSTIIELPDSAGKRKKSSRLLVVNGRGAKEKPTVDLSPVSWWSGSDELVIIKFINGNTYDGNVSMKRMHGLGKFAWSSGTSYLGKFCFNEMRGRGRIEWKDKTWYEGDFDTNIRHGRGMFVNSSEGLCYIGEWQDATKNGKGTIYYSHSSHHDGVWQNNIRHGFGAKEYSTISGYKGTWDHGNRSGRGIMIWPNHDYYNGEWKDGVMDGHGTYLWSAHRNETMSVSSQISYMGSWKNGMRHGQGIARFGYANGSHYKGQFVENKKHGKGSLVTGDGNILQSRKLFIDDNVTPPALDNYENSLNTTAVTELEPRLVEMCSENVDILYHIDQAIKTIDSRDQVLERILDVYIATNKTQERCLSNVSNRTATHLPPPPLNTSSRQFDIDYECKELRKAVRCYQTELKNIYKEYAMLCNLYELGFKPILIRLFIWQMYSDCKIYEKGLTLVQIDNMLYHNPAWLIESRHDPFEKIYYWQFVHSVISVATKLYYSSTGQCGIAFRKFMTDDLIPNFYTNKGLPRRLCMEDIPLKSMYKLYKSIGEPHTIRQFLQAIRYPPHLIKVQPPTVGEKRNEIVGGKNLFSVEDQLTYFIDPALYENQKSCTPAESELKLFILNLLPSKSIIQHFAEIFPQLVDNYLILNLDIKITFFEFYEVFLINAEDVVVLKEEMDREKEITSTIL